LTLFARRVISRIRCLNRSKAFGAMTRLTSGPAVKLNPRPRGSPKTGHRGSLQNRPTITIIQDVDFGARAATLGRCEQCLERGKEAASHSIWAARLVAAQDPEDHRCPPRNRR